MKCISKSKKKKYSFKRFIHSFGYSFNGIKEVYKREQNILVHTIVAIAALGVSIYLKVSNIELCIIILTIGLVLVSEIFNTSIERTVDLIMPNMHPLAKLSKDIAAGAVLISALIAVFIGVIIFLPKIIELLEV